MFGASDIPKFFFRAMRQGYVTSPSIKTTIAELPTSKVITVEEPGFKLVDCWLTGEGRNSAGTTTIFADGQPVWIMNYWGRYPSNLIPFLKEALAEDYLSDHPMHSDSEYFRGCRGPRLFNQGNLFYANMVAPGSTFWKFSGREEIFQDLPNHPRQGWHEYNGFMLL